MSRGPVHVGDVLRAAGALGVTGAAEVRALVRAMGLPAGPGTPSPGPTPAGTARTVPAARPRPATTRYPPGGDRLARLPDGAARPGLAPVRVVSAVTGRSSGGLAAGHAAPAGSPQPAGGSLLTFPPGPGRPDDEPAAVPGGAGVPRLPDESLFAMPDEGAAPERLPASPWNPRTERAIMLAVASTDAPGREVDPRRLIDLALRRLGGGPHAGGDRIPYRSRQTTRAGLIVLLDRGPSMRPFRHDLAWIARLARRVLPPDQVRVFDLRLAQGVSADGGRSWRRSLRQPPGTPVLLVSDLGHFRPPVPGRHHASPGEWLAFVRRLPRAGHPVVCVTPFRPEAYPAAVRRAVPLVALDRRTSVWSARGLTRRPGRTP